MSGAKSRAKDPPGKFQSVSEGENVGKEPETMKAVDVLKNLGSKKRESSKDSVKALEFIWKSVLSEKYEIGMVHLTIKNKGQLGHFLKQCPEGQARTLLRWLLGNWIEFVKDVELKAGVKITPAQPDVGFLLKHATVGINLAIANSGRSSKAQALHKAPNTPSLAAPTQLILSENDADDTGPKTLQELLAIINGKDEGHS